MRVRPATFGGWLPEQPVRRAAGAADRGEQENPLEHLHDVIGKAPEPVYGFRSLLAFKAKFRPLFMAYPDPSSLPMIGTAMGRAYLPHMTPWEGIRLARRLTRL